MELDHFFILTEPGAPQAELLLEIGLVEGTPNDHPGQGTANRRFFFSNAMLELGYIRDAKEAVEGSGARLRFAERVAKPNASPFGLILRPSHGSTDLPFEGWRYDPDYLGPEHYFLIGDNSELLEEPMCVYLPFVPPSPGSQPLSGDPFEVVTELRISVPVVRPSPVLETISEVKHISLRLNAPHLLEVVFNDEQRRQKADLRPNLPLVIHW